MAAPVRKKRRDNAERLARRLVGEGRISRELAEAALRRHALAGERFEEALVSCGLPEDRLLRALAETYRVQYISTGKLASINVNKAVLSLVPRQVAEQREVVPVLLDRKQSVLSIVTADPDDLETIKEIELASQVRSIRPLVARPSAVAAAIAKFYQGDGFAFSVLMNATADPSTGIERDLLAQIDPGPDSLAAASSGLRYLDEPARAPAEPAEAPRVTAPPGVSIRSPARVPEAPQSFSVPPSLRRPASIPQRPAPPVVDLTAHADSEPPEPVDLSTQAASEPPHPEIDLDEIEELELPSSPPQKGPPELESSPLPLALSPRHARKFTPPPASTEPKIELDLPPDVDLRRRASLRVSTPAAPPVQPKPRSEPAPAAPEPAPDAPNEAVGDTLSLVTVLVSLLEGSRRDLRGHSVQTARLVAKVCERLELPPARARAAEIAALIHDVGKASGSFHLTSFNVSQFDGHRVAAEKLSPMPARVLESARLSKEVVDAVTHMYECYDGSGFPDHLRGADIPLESRVLSICDTYADLTSNPRNSFRKVLSAQEACEALRERVGTVFDPKLVDVFARVVLGDDLAQQLRSDRGAVLLVDPDIEETTVLELALLEKRYDVQVARTAEEALGLMESGKGFDLIVSEMDLDGGSGFDFLRAVRGGPLGEAVAFVFFSNDTDGTKVAEALEAGAQDYLFKPLASKVVAAKVRHLLEQRHRQKAVRGVSGSLQEMGLPDIVQVLNQGRKSGALKLSTDGQSGTVYFRDGAIVDAVWGDLRGAEAFYALVGVQQGDFTIDPTAVPNEQTIQIGAESLLLEGLRRLDEANR